MEQGTGPLRPKRPRFAASPFLDSAKRALSLRLREGGQAIIGVVFRSWPPSRVNR
jgi:hypothetical protein